MLPAGALFLPMRGTIASGLRTALASAPVGLRQALAGADSTPADEAFGQVIPTAPEFRHCDEPSNSPLHPGPDRAQ